MDAGAAEVEGGDHATGNGKHATLTSVIIQIMILDLVFSIDSVITAVGIADHVEIMIAAVIVAILVMMVAAESIASGRGATNGPRRQRQDSLPAVHT